MNMQLSREEERFVNDLLRWDRTERSSQRVLCHLFLALGLVVFIAAAVLFLQHMNDHTAAWVMVPGGLIAALFFGLYAVGEHWIRRRRLFASILRKLFNEA